MLTLPKQNDFETVPAGSYAAVCYRVLDLGSQFSTFYQKSSHKIMISWELDEKMKDGRKFSIHKRYTLSSGKNSHLRKDLEAWRGKAFTEEEFGSFDLGKLIGIGCMIGVSTRAVESQTYSDVASIMALPKGMPKQTVENPVVYFSLNEFNQEIYDQLSDGLKAVIAKSPEYQELKGGKDVERQTSEGHEVPEHDPDSIPF